VGSFGFGKNLSDGTKRAFLKIRRLKITIFFVAFFTMPSSFLIQNFSPKQFAYKE
jgi:hypothetical protein